MKAYIFLNCWIVSTQMVRREEGYGDDCEELGLGTIIIQSFILAIVQSSTAGALSK